MARVRFTVSRVRGAKQIKSLVRRYTLAGCVAVVLLAGCDVLRQAQDVVQPPVGTPDTMPRTATTAAHILLVGEQGPSYHTGVIAVYRAPFHSSPQILRLNSPKGLTVAPNGALIAAGAYDGSIWVFDPPFKHKRLLHTVPGATGQFLFDSRQELIVPSEGSGIYVFKSPYKGAPVKYFGVPALVVEVAIDSEDDVFVGTQGTSSGMATYECKPPSYQRCAELSIGNGSATVDSSDDLLTGISSDRVAAFPPPYRHAKVEAAVPFEFYWLSVANQNATFVAGASMGNYLGVFPQTIKGRFMQLSVEQYFIPGLGYSVARDRDLFVSDGTYQKPYVSIYTYPYSGKARKHVPVKYPIMSVFAQ